MHVKKIQFQEIEEQPIRRRHSCPALEPVPSPVTFSSKIGAISFSSKKIHPFPLPSKNSFNEKMKAGNDSDESMDLFDQDNTMVLNHVDPNVSQMPMRAVAPTPNAFYRTKTS